MTQQATTVHKQASGGISWKHLWRLDAVFNLLFADLLIFAPGTVIEFMGMEANATNFVRAVGAAFAVYGLWQLWAARTGTISKLSFLLADVDMTLVGIASIAGVLLGVEFNDLGTGLMIGFMGVGGFIMAGLWYMASRQAE